MNFIFGEQCKLPLDKMLPKGNALSRAEQSRVIFLFRSLAKIIPAQKLSLTVLQKLIQLSIIPNTKRLCVA